ncbi:Uncharacterised protein [Listeria fleischmannii subsp. fleischmannii]|uniref:Accessory Sec system protein Asp2 n=3 Tax=Listeria fleischmannii TaxID=1069827 RepID=A0A2X3GTQ9_9LIST|nr:Uncharacterised protein [Listeria fleischmannii subsp. fleischmannii]
MRKGYFYIKQKRQKMSNGITLTFYMKENTESEDLLVIYSALPVKGSSVYNYVRTLDDVNCNKLYILDDFGENRAGVFYLGENGTMDVRDAVKELITNIQKNKKIQHTFFSGTSKGGFAALYLGIDMQVDKIIVGSPIVKVKHFLQDTEEKRAVYRGITGEKEKYEYNHLLLQRIQEQQFDGEIYLQYSELEEIYENQIDELVETLEKNKYTLSKENGMYSKHLDTRFFFPMYLRKIFNTSDRNGV